MNPTSLRSFKSFPNCLARTGPAALSMAIVFVLAVGATPTAQAQTFTVIHNFTRGADGGHPYAGLTIDAAGNLYGTTKEGGSTGYGTVFKVHHSRSSWILTALYNFFILNDGGAFPLGRVALAADGTLYGTTSVGGGGIGCDGGLRLSFPVESAADSPKDIVVPLGPNRAVSLYWRERWRGSSG